MGNADLLCCNRFQSTLPMRGATLHNRHCQCNHSYFNPHSPCGERLAVLLSCTYHTIISIHTPHAGSDRNDRYSHICKHGFQSTLPMRGATRLWVEKCQSCLISIHTPHAGSDRTVGGMSRTYAGFQSTLPMRGATIILIDGAEKLSISIHTPHAGSDIWLGCTITQIQISIHTPHAGSDWCKGAGTGGKDNFNPHSPCGERPRNVFPFFRAISNFNPHSPCGERLVYFSGSFHFSQYFNPHSPCGERLANPAYGVSIRPFQSTLPMRGATAVVMEYATSIRISIHTPHAGSDAGIPECGLDAHDFNPHSPCGERLESNYAESKVG